MLAISPTRVGNNNTNNINTALPPNTSKNHSNHVILAILVLNIILAMKAHNNNVVNRLIETLKKSTRRNGAVEI